LGNIKSKKKIKKKKGLLNEDSFIFKRTIFILKTIVVKLKNGEISIKNEYFYNEKEQKNIKEFENNWEKYFFIIETLSQTSYHLTKEIWKEIINLLPKERIIIDFYWLEVIFIKSCTEASTSIKKLALNTLFEYEYKIPFMSLEFISTYIITFISDQKMYRLNKETSLLNSTFNFFNNYFFILKDEQRKELFSKILYSLINPKFNIFILSLIYFILLNLKFNFLKKSHVFDYEKYYYQNFDFINEEKDFKVEEKLELEEVEVEEEDNNNIINDESFKYLFELLISSKN
jgi:hypothetical protein